MVSGDILLMLNMHRIFRPKSLFRRRTFSLRYTVKASQQFEVDVYIVLVY